MANEKLPGVLAFQRGMIITDGIMKNIINFKGDLLPGETEKVYEADRIGSNVKVIRHGIRGTQKSKGNGDGVSNIQVTESAKTETYSKGVQVSFNINFLNLKELLFSCSDNDFRTKINGFMDKFLDSNELKEVCHRYARNILNGKWLWRNEILGNHYIEVFISGTEKPLVSCSGGNKSFNVGFTEEEHILAEAIYDKITIGDERALKIVAKINFGFTGSVEVYPSQNMLTDKPKGFARSLYKVNIQKNANPNGKEIDILHVGDAAIRDQKIGNAIRQIDTWYNMESPDDVEAEEAISVEPNGASIKYDKEFRNKKNDTRYCLLQISNFEPYKSLYDYKSDKRNYDNLVAFMLAVFMRGAVLSEKKGDE